MPVDKEPGSEPDLPIPDYLRYDDDGIDFGATLLAYREQFDVSRRSLGEILDCTQTAVANWEQGKTSPREESRRIIIDRLYLPERRDEVYEKDPEGQKKDELSLTTPLQILPVSPTTAADSSIATDSLFAIAFAIGQPLTAAEVRRLREVRGIASNKDQS